MKKTIIRSYTCKLSIREKANVRLSIIRYHHKGKHNFKPEKVKTANNCNDFNLYEL